jgi:ABC-type polysaccharide/polyol phosphate export permease
VTEVTVFYSSTMQRSPIAGSIQLLKGLLNKRQLFLELVASILRKRYKGSYLGVFWTMLNPLMTMFGLALVFPLIIKFRMDDYIIYLFSGILAWNMISTSVVGGGDAILANQGFIRKVYLPKLIFPIVLVSAELVNTVVTAMMLHVIALIFDFSINTNIFYLLAAIVLTYLFGICVAAITSVLVVYYRDVKYMLGVVMQTLFYLSAIIFPITLLPEKYRFFMEFNVFYQFVRLFHQAIYYGDTSDWSLFAIPVIVVCVMFFLVILLHQKVDRYVVYRL